MAAAAAGCAAQRPRRAARDGGEPSVRGARRSGQGAWRPHHQGRCRGCGGAALLQPRVPRLRRPPSSPAAAPAPSPARPGRVEQRVPMTRLRARIAERLVQAQATQALLTTSTRSISARCRSCARATRRCSRRSTAVKLGFMSFFVKAAIEALKRFPVVNAAVDGNDIVYHEYFDIGVAVSTERGLMVPVLRDADAMSFAEIEQAHRRIRRARARRLDHARRPDRRHLQHHQRRRLRLADVHAHRQCAAERDSRHAQDPGAADGGGWRRS